MTDLHVLSRKRFQHASKNVYSIPKPKQCTHTHISNTLDVCVCDVLNTVPKANDDDAKRRKGRQRHTQYTSTGGERINTRDIQTCTHTYARTHTATRQTHQEEREKERMTVREQLQFSQYVRHTAAYNIPYHTIHMCVIWSN